MVKPVYTEEQKLRIEKIIQLLNRYTELYDKGVPAISNKEWDDLYFELVALEEETGLIYPDSPTKRVIFSAVSALEKTEHGHDMLSLDKTKSIEEVKEFLQGREYLAMDKMDGLTCSLRYVGGKLVSAETRGDGKIGENILHNARVLENIPKIISYKEDLVVDGEVICDYESFKSFSDKYKNPRNFAAGSIRLLDSKECSSRNLSFVAWDVIKGFDDCVKVSDKLDKLENYGFTVVPYTSGDGIERDIEKLKASAVTFGYPIDGVVFKFDNIEYGKSLGKTEHHFKNAIAFKFYDEEVESRLLDIEFNVGRTGVLTPVAIYEDVEIEGSVCNRASLHNISVLLDVVGSRPYKGQPIKVVKKNMIIPQITWAEKNPEVVNFIEPPLSCPSCGGNLAIIDNDGVRTLWCANPHCYAKISQRINHFCGKKGLDIKGLSISTIEKLVEWDWLKEVKDLYDLHLHKSEWIRRTGFGEKSVEKILSAIEESKNCELWRFISGLGIPLVGTTVSKEIAKICPTWEDFKDKRKGSWAHLNGFGLEIERAIQNFDYDEADELAAACHFTAQTKVEDVSTSAAALTFCITGKVNKWKNRDSLKDYIESIGGKVVSSMSSKVSYLINNDSLSTSSKNIAAKKAGVPIITEEEFIGMFGQG